MSNAVDKELLDQIYAQYVRLSGRNDLEAFNGSHLTGDAMLKEYIKFLKTLSHSIRDEIACKPPCDGGSCPPCDEWDRSKYVEYINKLSSKSA
jgi:hypothetical protein